MKAGEMQTEGNNRAVTKISSCQAYEISRWGTERQRHKQLGGLGACPQEILKCRDPEMSFSAFSRFFLLQM